MKKLTLIALLTILDSLMRVDKKICWHCICSGVHCSLGPDGVVMFFDNGAEKEVEFGFKTCPEWQDNRKAVSDIVRRILGAPNLTGSRN